VNLTLFLVAINVLAYVWLVSTGGLSSDKALFDHGALLGVACIKDGQWWRIVSGGFLHGSIPHIALNMIALFQLGTACESMFGRLRFALLYAISLLGAGLAVVAFAPNDLTVGASGAIFGLFGGLVAVGLRLGSRGRGLIGQVLPIILINLVFTFAVPGISASGHVGGLITGLVAGLVLFMVPPRRRADMWAYVPAPAADPAAVETIEQPPPLEVRDPRE
jgi:membrane associated rhomboid family serine protease